VVDDVPYGGEFHLFISHTAPEWTMMPAGQGQRK